MHSRHFLGILQFGQLETEWRMIVVCCENTDLPLRLQTCKMQTLKGFFCAEDMEEVVLDVSAQRSITERSNNVCTALAHCMVFV